MCENIHPTTYLTCKQTTVMSGGHKWEEEGRALKKKKKVTIKALKEIPHGFGVLKYFYAILLFILKDLKASETHANYSNPCMASSECARSSQMC